MLYLLGLALSPILLIVAWIVLRLAYRASIYWGTYLRYSHIPKLPKAFSLFDLMSTDGGFSNWMEYTYDSKTGTVPKVSDHGFSMTLDGSHYLMFNTAEAAKQILTDTQLFPKLPMTYTLVEPLLGKGLVTSEGKVWKDHRRLLTPLFHFNNLKNNIVVINDFIRKDLDKIQNEIRNSKNGVHELDTEKFFKHLTMSVIIAVAFGGEFNIDWMSQKWSELVQSLNKVFVLEMVLGPIYKYLPLGTSKFWELREQLLDEIKKAIAHRRANPVADDKAVDLMSAMLRIKEEDLALSDKDIIDQSLTFLFAGHDTTASSLSWAIYFLAKHPEEFKKARAEVDRVLGPRSANEQISISADKIHELEYCKAIFFETIRVRTPVVGVDRYPTRDTEIDGVKVKAGQISAIGIGFFNIHRNPLYWPQPEKFIPERFVTGSAHHDPKRHPFAFVPFSAGERNCIGMKLAQNEAFLAIAHIVRRFDFSVNDANMIHASAPLYVPKNLVWQVRERQD